MNSWIGRKMRAIDVSLQCVARRGRLDSDVILAMCSFSHAPSSHEAILDVFAADHSSDPSASTRLDAPKRRNPFDGLHLLPVFGTGQAPRYSSVWEYSMVFPAVPRRRSWSRLCTPGRPMCSEVIVF